MPRNAMPPRDPPGSRTWASLVTFDGAVKWITKHKAKRIDKPQVAKSRVDSLTDALSENKNNTPAELEVNCVHSKDQYGQQGTDDAADAPIRCGNPSPSTRSTASNTGRHTLPKGSRPK